MRRSRITITLNQNTINQVDLLIDKNKIRNRSHAIEYVLNQCLQPKIRKAVILAGGQGTKLRPYTYEVPKAMLPVKGKPILEHLINQLKKSGISEIIMCTGYLGDKIKEHFGTGKSLGVTITYSEEKQPLHTGGALLKVQKYIGNETFLVIHGDILTTLSFQELIDFHQKEGRQATVALTTVDSPSQFGQLTLRGTKLIHFYQKQPKAEVKSYLIHTGMYVFETNIFKYFPKNQTNFSLEDVIEKMVKEQQVNGYVFEGQWFDVGSPENYERAIKEYRA
jgi:NDP-sugar pyrophosphorylase family protein